MFNKNQTTTIFIFATPWMWPQNWPPGCEIDCDPSSCKKRESGDNADGKARWPPQPLCIQFCNKWVIKIHVRYNITHHSCNMNRPPCDMWQPLLTLVEARKCLTDAVIQLIVCQAVNPSLHHDGLMTWWTFSAWPFVRGIHRWSVDCPLWG